MLHTIILLWSKNCILSEILSYWSMDWNETRNPFSQKVSKNQSYTVQFWSHATCRLVMFNWPIYVKKVFSVKFCSVFLRNNIQHKLILRKLLLFPAFFRYQISSFAISVRSRSLDWKFQSEIESQYKIDHYWNRCWPVNLTKWPYVLIYNHNAWFEMRYISNIYHSEKYRNI